ncbi:DDE-type transposase [Pseudomonas caricapapayae]|uniref:DDE-type transposase n=1 Tax=Pseudomonas caricapapayae TaxID=46678 RepID=A0A0P9PUE3_9PSED|nr:DDE-type transposase [Pseudomonas caricapapayae]RMM06733.1 DDE-type transposase [Pseudomonas caricapapayae]RMV73299.1 DDE-type transposase [Pseudomonas caricapapayae]RMV97399.1 hypothetical protein ALP01_200508 [Pseudomonas caricapapayae]
MIKQMTFANTEYAGKLKQTRKELLLIEMDRVVPWKGLITRSNHITQRTKAAVLPIR